MEATTLNSFSSFSNRAFQTDPDRFVKPSEAKVTKAYSLLSAGHSSNIEWYPTPGASCSPSAYVFFINSPPSVLFESAFQRLQTMQDSGFNTSIAKSAAAVSATLAGVYALDEQGKNRSAARELMGFIEAKLRKNALAEINQLLAEADVSCMRSRSMTGLIRSTYRLKDDLPAWTKAYRDSWKQVSKQGKSPEALFVGLPSVMEDAVAAPTK